MARNPIWTHRRASVCPALSAAARALCVGVLAVLVTAPVGIRPANATVYTITDLGTLGGDQAVPWGMNNQGQVVGWSFTAAGEQHSFLYDGTGMHNLVPLLGNAWVGGIGGAGQFVGDLGLGTDSSSPPHAFF